MTRRYLEQNEMKIQLQILWDAAKAVLTGKFIALKWLYQKKEKFQINDLNTHLKKQKGENK